jgi:hypothetical protein
LPLQALINATGVAVDYVGTREQGLHREVHWPPGFDPHHEAYYGANAGYVRDQLRAHLGQFAAPDIALIHLGTNDLGSSELIEPLEDIIRLLRMRNPHVVVLVGQLTLHDWKAPWRRFRVSRMVERLNAPSRQSSPSITSRTGSRIRAARRPIRTTGSIRIRAVSRAWRWRGLRHCVRI